MLKQGRAVVDQFKGETESVVGEVKATIETVTGLWDWATGLWASLTGKPKQETAIAPTPIPQKKSVAKKASRAEPDGDVLQMQVVHEVSQQLGKFFDIQRQIQTHYKNLEEESLHIYETNQNHAMKAIERVEVELQLEEMSKKIRETMVYAPMELKDLYSRFLTMYGRIKDEQEFARQEQQKQARDAKVKKWQRQNNRIDRLLATAGVALAVLWIWALMAAVIMQKKMLTNFWSD